MMIAVKDLTVEKNSHLIVVNVILRLVHQQLVGTDLVTFLQLPNLMD